MITKNLQTTEERANNFVSKPIDITPSETKNDEEEVLL